jgi:hypothetical protein
MPADFSVESHHEVDARLERVKALWREITGTPRTSTRYQLLTEEIRAEAAAYLAAVDAEALAVKRLKALKAR